MKRFLVVSLLIAVLLSACGTAAMQGEGVQEDLLVTIYKLPTWGCCGTWTEYLKGNGFKVKTENVETLVEVTTRYQVPAELQSCHTAIVDGYVVEGHVPVAEIERLLQERPDVIGIAVAGMPAGAPGMDIEGFDSESFDVVTFDKEGTIQIYSSYQ